MKHGRSDNITNASHLRVTQTGDAHTGRHARVVQQQTPSNPAHYNAAAAARFNAEQRRASAAGIPGTSAAYGTTGGPGTPGAPGSDPYSRTAQRTYARAAEEARKRKRNRRIRNVLLAVLAVVVAAAVAAFAYFNVLNANLGRGISSGLQNVLVQTNLTKQPFYMLLLGTDQSIERDAEDAFEGTYRTDSIILARIDPVAKKATLVSLPRDLKINYPGHGTAKLNAAYAYGGAELAIQTVNGVTGVGLSHFMLVDMDGLAAVVDALGGIEVDVPFTIDDEYTGHLDAGLQTLNGQQALIFARARHVYDDIGDGDTYRSANQRTVLAAIAKKILASDPLTMAATVEKLTEYVQTDLTLNDLVGLAQAMQGFDTARDFYTATMPNEGVFEDDVWWAEPVQPDWDNMMERVRAGLAPTETSQIDEYTGIALSTAGDGAAEAATAAAQSTAASIVVRNGSGYDGLGAAAAASLTAAGYTVDDVGNAEWQDYEDTLVIYDDASRARQAQTIAAVVGHGAYAFPNDGDYNVPGDFLVLVGSLYQEY